jgi:hypothetical protein
MYGPKKLNGGAVIACCALASSFLLPIEFVISAMIFTLVVRCGLHLLQLADSGNAKPEELDET